MYTHIFGHEECLILYWMSLVLGYPIKPILIEYFVYTCNDLRLKSVGLFVITIFLLQKAKVLSGTHL